LCPRGTIEVTQLLGKKSARSFAFIVEMNRRIDVPVIKLRKQMMVKMMNKLIIDNRIAIKNLANQYGIKTICLFGSMAKDEISDNSDVDFLVELEQGRDLFDLGELLIDLQVLLKRKVDLVTKTSLHPRLYSQVLNEALPL
jgi:predicted nucleotidyltransferase